MSSDVRSDAIWVVLRQLRFVQGGAVAVPLKTVSRREDAEQACKVLVEQFDRRMATDQPFKLALAEIGVVGCSFMIGAMEPPDSKIIRPVPQLVVPA